MRPRLIHVIRIPLHRRNIAENTMDMFGDVDGDLAFLEPVILSAQISYSVKDRVLAEGLGNAPQASGYALCYKEEWDNIQGKVGDEFEFPDSRCAIVEARPAGHYHGKAYFVKLFFERKRVS